MRTLAEDRDEVETDAARRWVARKRREYGIGADEPACWEAHVWQGLDRFLVAIGSSPGDVLHDAELYAEARFAARRDGVGRWTMEVYGDGENAPVYLSVRPAYDEAMAL